MQTIYFAIKSQIKKKKINSQKNYVTFQISTRIYNIILYNILN